MVPGYAGKIGWIDLTKNKIEAKELEAGIARKYLGGKGLGAYLLYRYLKPNTDPYTPENIMIFITGPLTGTSFPAVSRSGVITKSPMTGTFLDSYSGGIFGSQLKWAGFDALVIQGKSEKPCYLQVEDGGITIQDADHLWGLPTLETEKQLKNTHKKEAKSRVSVAAIGQAGENLVRYASIINEKRAHGRGGAGAVMGSKNLKAIVAAGENKVPIADEAAFKDIIKRCRKNIATHPMTGKGKVFPTIGTMMTVDVTQKTGTLPTRNWQENTYDKSSSINGDAFLEYAVTPRSCYACPIGCSRDTKALIGDKEYITEGPDYETIYSFGPNCDIHDPEVIIAADKLCDEYGMDTISCGVTIGFAMECFEKGVLDKDKTNGIELTFGNGDALLEVIHLIARKEGIGKLLAKGSKRASEEIERSAHFAMHVKGLELPGYDPRGMKGQGLSYALSDRGGCHVRANTLRTELLGLPEPIDRYSYEGKAEMVRDLQLGYTSSDCLIACLFGSLAISPEDYADAISAETGWSFSSKDLRTVAERAWNLTRLFNTREGFTRKDDTLPERLFTESSTEGHSKDQVVDKTMFEKMLDEYYRVVGWDKLTGVPTDEKLRDLELDRSRS